MVPRVRASTALASVLLFPSLGAAALAGPCSNDAFVVDGMALGVEVCDVRIAAAARAKATAAPAGEVRETLSARGRSLVRSVAYDRLGNEETARTLDDIPLQALGIGRTMHVTLAVHDGTARLEHALLVPGATPLK